MMMRHSQNVRTKGKRSFREKQVRNTCVNELHKKRKVDVLIYVQFEYENIIKGYFFPTDCPSERAPEKEEAT